jgi:intein/homing endonuclease
MSKVVKHGKQNRFSLDWHQGIEAEAINLPIDPYLLGAWLGDGHSKGAAITVPDPAIIAEISKLGYNVTVWKSSDNGGAALTYGITGGFKAELRENNLLYNKHIPEIYLRASKGQRLALVQGLMDTDGFCSERGQCEFSNTKYQIIEGLQELLSSLGIEHRTTLKQAGTYKDLWRVRFTTTKQVFRLSRKRARLRTSVDKCAVTSIEEIESVPVRCVSVDCDSELFLFGKTMLPTRSSVHIQ